MAPPVKGKKKELEVVKVANTSLFALRFKGGGQLPEELNGSMWTSADLAEKEIQQYYDARGDS